MLIWEYNDGTFGPSPLVTGRSSTDATLDNREDQQEGRGEEKESEGTTSTTSTGTPATDRPAYNDRWRGEGHSQR